MNFWPFKKEEKTQVRADNWYNDFTGRGKYDYDKLRGYKVQDDGFPAQQDLYTLYKQDGIARKIIDRIVDDSLRQGFSVEGDTENTIYSWFKSKAIQAEFATGFKLARLTGGAVIVIYAKNSGENTSPLNENRTYDISYLKAYDRYCITWQDQDLYDDPSQANYGMPEYITIQPKLNSTLSFKIHTSRVLWIDGIETPDYIKAMNNNWSTSALQAIWHLLRAYSTTHSNIETIIEHWDERIVKVKGLAQMYASGMQSAIQTRLNSLDMTRGNMHTLVCDLEENVERSTGSVAGLKEIMIEQQNLLSGLSEYPNTILWGQSPAGLNATGSNDLRIHYDRCKCYQNEEILPSLSRLLKIAYGEEISNKIVFNPLWQDSTTELIANREKQSKIDDVYIASGVLLPEEVRESRFGGDSYSYETVIDDSGNFGDGSKQSEENNE